MINKDVGNYIYDNPFGSLVGETLSRVIVSDSGDDYIIFVTDRGDALKMYHSQQCCENVSIDDINGDIDDLVGVPILVADERSAEDENASESGTWTFYTIRTIKGTVDVRWYGYSNGYYSEAVDFCYLEDDSY